MTGPFEWDAEEQGFVLGAFYVGYLVGFHKGKKDFGSTNFKIRSSQLIFSRRNRNRKSAVVPIFLSEIFRFALCSFRKYHSYKEFSISDVKMLF